MIKSRKTFEGTTKNGKSRKVTIFFSREGAQELLAAATTAANGPDGASLTIFIGESTFKAGEVYASIALEASTPTARYQATATQSTTPRVGGAAPAGGAPKFAFKPKIQSKA
jgi:hypothetical protein